MGNCCSCCKIPSAPVTETNASLEKDQEEIGGRRAGTGGGGGGGGGEGVATATAMTEDPTPNGAGIVLCPAAASAAAAAPCAAPAAAVVATSEPPSPPRGPRSLCGGRLARDAAPSDPKIHALFDAYRDPQEDAMLADGIERLCADLALSPDEFKVLVLAWRLGAARMCRFSREEFVLGLRSLRADSLRSLQQRLPEAAAEAARDADLFKDLYRFTFRFGLDVEAGQRALPTDMAACLWRLVFSARPSPPPVLERWLHFLEGHPHVRAIPRDTWNMFLNFADAVGNDLSSYDDTEAWPSLFDDFVEYENDKANQNIAKDREPPIIETWYK